MASRGTQPVAFVNPQVDDVFPRIPSCHIAVLLFQVGHDRHPHVFAFVGGDREIWHDQMEPGFHSGGGSCRRRRGRCRHVRLHDNQIKKAILARHPTHRRIKSSHDFLHVFANQYDLVSGDGPGTFEVQICVPSEERCPLLHEKRDFAVCQTFGICLEEIGVLVVPDHQVSPSSPVHQIMRNVVRRHSGLPIASPLLLQTEKKFVVHAMPIKYPKLSARIHKFSLFIDGRSKVLVCRMGIGPG